MTVVFNVILHSLSTSILCLLCGLWSVFNINIFLLFSFMVYLVSFILMKNKCEYEVFQWMQVGAKSHGHMPRTEFC